MKPGRANSRNAQCQSTYFRVVMTSGAVKAPPQRANVHMIPWARTRSRCGSQTVKALAMFGNPPASPAPNRNWQTQNDGKFHILPNSAVKVDVRPLGRR